MTKTHHIRSPQGTLALGRVWVLWLLLTLVGASSPSHAEDKDDPTGREVQIKASFLFHFAQFVEWPDVGGGLNEGVLTIGVMGDRPFTDALREILQHKTVRGQTVVIKPVETTAGARACQILFLGDLRGTSLEKVLKEMSGTQILTVGGAADFIEHGGMIRLFKQKNK